MVEALTEAEINLMTVSDVMGRGRQKGVAEVYRSHVEPGGLLRKVKLEIAVNDDFVKPTIDAIVQAARTGNIGDGKIFVLDLEECIRIRTGETGRGHRLDSLFLRPPCPSGRSIALWTGGFVRAEVARADVSRRISLPSRPAAWPDPR